MRPPRLSRRLRAVVALVPRGGVVADIGTDHALVPAWLVASGVVPSAIAVDRNRAPLGAARRTLRVCGVGDRVQLRLGSGMNALADHEAQTIVVAGLGESTISAMMNTPRPAGLQRLILQPNGDGEDLRAAVSRAHTIVDEVLVHDRGRPYPIVVAEPAARPPTLDPADRILGPVLRRRRGTSYEEWIARRLVDARAHLGAERSARRPDTGRLEALEAAVTIMEGDQRRGA